MTGPTSKTRRNATVIAVIALAAAAASALGGFDPPQRLARRAAGPVPAKDAEVRVATTPSPTVEPQRNRQAALVALDAPLPRERGAARMPAVDAFAPRSWNVVPPLAPTPPPPVAPASPPPAPPLAPPLPFKYLGMMEDSAAPTVWYLAEGEHLLVAATGQTVQSDWRIDGARGGRLHFTYLPLESLASIAIGGVP